MCQVHQNMSERIDACVYYCEPNLSVVSVAVMHAETLHGMKILRKIVEMSITTMI